MTNPGNGHDGPDWDSIFSQARRRVFARVAVVAAIAGVGSLFLLGGGLSAQGTVTWKNVFGEPSSPQSNTNRKKHEKHEKPSDQPPGKEKNHGNQPGHKKHKEPKHPPKPPKPCEDGSAAGSQYCDNPDESGAQSTEGKGGTSSLG